MIQQTAISTREAVKAFNKSGALMELAESVQVAATAAKDTAQDAKNTTRELRDSQVAAETANAVEQT
ncbi:MAG: hypothetical protein ACRD8Z_14195, partial [Nitrososphaeraceae archaeon]